MYPIDANVFLRFLTNDDPIKAEACKILFKRADAREIEITTSEAIVAEVIYVLESKKNNGYALSRYTIRDIVSPLLRIKGLKFSGRVICLHALDIFVETNLDYEDALLIAYAERDKTKRLYSYDSGIDVVASIIRIEP